MNLNDFLYISTIAECGSFTTAAKQLYIAQPSLSQRVKYIEGTYDISIFIRDIKGVRLTKEGEVFVKYANQILNAEQEMRRSLNALHNPDKQLIRLGTTQLMRSYLFDKLIMLFNQEYPNTQFDFIEDHSSRLQEQIAAGKLDIAIIYLPLEKPDIPHQVIFQDRFVLVPAVDSALEQKIRARQDGEFEPVSFDLLDGQPFSTAPSPTKLNRYITLNQKKHNINLDIKHYGKNYSMLYYMARSGIASTIICESFFNPSNTYIPYYYFDDEDSELYIAVIWRKDSFISKIASSLIRIAKQIQHIDYSPENDILSNEQKKIKNNQDSN